MTNLMAEAETKEAHTPGAVTSFPVFRDHRGNRFIFPGLYRGAQDMLDAELWGRCRAIVAALGVTQEAECFDAPTDDGVMTFPHVRAEAGSSWFAHGSSAVFLIGGPTFDAISRAEA